MFIHNFKYTIKTLFKKKMLIFWTFAFPIILGTLFNLAFSDLEKNDKLEIIDIAIVENNNFNNNQVYKEAFKSLSDKENKDRLFSIKYTTKDKAKKLLDDREITGYLILNEEPEIFVAQNGINETVFKYAVEEINQTESMISNLSQEEIKKQIMSGNTNVNYKLIYSNVMNKINSKDVKFKDVSKSNLSYTMIEFYTLIAMTCLYGGLLGMTAINQTLANMSSNGKRVAVSPISKWKMVLSSLLGSYVVQIVGLALLFIYTVFVLKVDYGDNLPLIIIFALAGSFAGLSMSTAVGTLLKSNEATKTGIVLGITMLGCFLAGMMGMNFKYIIDKNAPVVNKLNPAGMITDGFYALYYYDTLNRYLFNLISLIIFAIIMILLSYSSLRRQKYDSI